MNRIASAVIVAGTITGISACSGSPAPAASPAATTAASTAASSAVTPSATPAQPETAAAAKAVALQYLGLYSAGQFATSYPLLTPAAQKAVPESAWVAVHQGCPSVSAGMAYEIKNVTMTGSTAVMTVTLAGAASGLASASEAFIYSGGKWGFSPSDLNLYEHSSVAADIAAAKAAGDCASN
jgi:hypothetical protein